MSLTNISLAAPTLTVSFEESFTGIQPISRATNLLPRFSLSGKDMKIYDLVLLADNYRLAPSDFLEKNSTDLDVTASWIWDTVVAAKAVEGRINSKEFALLPKHLELLRRFLNAITPSNWSRSLCDGPRLEHLDEQDTIAHVNALLTRESQYSKGKFRLSFEDRQGKPRLDLRFDSEMRPDLNGEVSADFRELDPYRDSVTGAGVVCRDHHACATLNTDASTKTADAFLLSPAARDEVVQCAFFNSVSYLVWLRQKKDERLGISP